jgi:hypothetical protein
MVVGPNGEPVDTSGKTAARSHHPEDDFERLIQINPLRAGEPRIIPTSSQAGPRHRRGRGATEMPLAAYFWKIGAVLLALLFVVNFCLPKASTVRDAAEDRRAIRIHSDQKWPERVVFDTRSPAIVANAPAVSSTETATAADRIAPPVIRAETPAVANALAMLPRPDSRPPESVDRKRQHKSQHVATRPKRHMKQMFVAARQPQFAWFGFRPW